MSLKHKRQIGADASNLRLIVEHAALMSVTAAARTNLPLSILTMLGLQEWLNIAREGRMTCPIELAE